MMWWSGQLICVKIFPILTPVSQSPPILFIVMASELPLYLWLYLLIYPYLYPYLSLYPLYAYCFLNCILSKINRSGPFWQGCTWLCRYPPLVIHSTERKSAPPCTSHLRARTCASPVVIIWAKQKYIWASRQARVGSELYGLSVSPWPLIR